MIFSYFWIDLCIPIKRDYYLVFCIKLLSSSYKIFKVLSIFSSLYLNYHIFNRFLLLDLRSTMMIFLFWIPSQKSSNLMVPIHVFKKGLKHWKLFNILRIPTMMANVKWLLLVSLQVYSNVIKVIA
jgi:hypothetical protein